MIYFFIAICLIVLLYIIFGNDVKKDQRREQLLKQQASTKTQNEITTKPNQIMNETHSYISIDFETANNNRISACAIGFVVVEKGIVTDQGKYYINPPESEEFLKSHSRIHGITRSKVENELSWDKLFENKLFNLLNNKLLICHNASMDISIIRNLTELFNLPMLNSTFIDTMNVAKALKLPTKIKDLTSEFAIKYNDTHDPEIDAFMCHEVFQRLSIFSDDILKFQKSIAKEEKTISNYASGYEYRSSTNSFIDRMRISLSELDSFLFIDKSFLITGDLPDEREDLQAIIEERGGLIKSGVSGKLDYIIIGEGYGPSKLAKAEDYVNAGKANIKVLTEEDFYYLLSR